MLGPLKETLRVGGVGEVSGAFAYLAAVKTKKKKFFAGGRRRLMNLHTICVARRSYCIEKWYTLRLL